MVGANDHLWSEAVIESISDRNGGNAPSKQPFDTARIVHKSGRPSGRRPTVQEQDQNAIASGESEVAVANAPRCSVRR
jgi:hypothetical protein